MKYVKTEVEGGWYHGFTRPSSCSVTGSAGDVEAWGGDHVRINDRFFKGGNTFRGFQIAGIGPRDTLRNGRALGGKVYAIGTVELTIPTFLPEQYGIKAALFTDFGTVGLLDLRQGTDQHDDGPAINDPNIKDDLACALGRPQRLLEVADGSDPVRLQPVLQEETYDKTETFRFSTATRF